MGEVAEVGFIFVLLVNLKNIGDRDNDNLDKRIR